MEYVEFGTTGLCVSRLAFGTGTNGWAGRSEQADLGVDVLATLLRLAYDQGVNFWDAADAYASHPHLAKALAGIPRDDVVIATKTQSLAAGEVKEDIDRFLRELHTDVLDVVLLHCVTQADWPRRYAGAMDALSRAKELGKVRAVGVSCHGARPLRAAAESEWAEVVLARINADGVHMGASLSDTVSALEQLFAAGKAIYGMKVLGCGELSGQARRAIEYVLGLGVVHSLSVGMSRDDHLLENAGLVRELAPRYPLRGPARRTGDGPGEGDWLEAEAGNWQSIPRASGPRPATLWRGRRDHSDL